MPPGAMSAPAARRGSARDGGEPVVEMAKQIDAGMDKSEY
eukprot:COSAG01_NODE_57047_length_314_cov_5.390698_1_plen_39_part_01